MAKVKKKVSKKKASTKRTQSKSAGASAKNVHDAEANQTLNDLLRDQGFEDASRTSYQMPFLRILQKLSPECDKHNPKFIKGAEPGHIIHTVSREIYDEVVVVPLKYKDSYIEWVPRPTGGFVGEWDALDPATSERLAACVKNEKNANILPNGNEFTLHSNYFCAFESDDGVWEPVVISMSKSQLKTSRVWLSTLRGMKLEVGGQTYNKVNIRSYQWNLGTELHKKDDNTWFGWTCEVGENTIELPQIGPLQSQVVQALKTNLLTYDRSDQQDDAPAFNPNANAL